MAKYVDGGNFPKVYEDISPESYVRKYFIEPSEDHPMKFPRAILERLGFMGGLSPMDFWMWLLEPPQLGEHRHMKGQRLVWGYVDRLANCAAIFVGLNQESQNYILKARMQEKPIWWRGDAMENFKAIARESYRYNQLTDDEKMIYRRSALKQAMAGKNAKAA